MKTDMSLNLLNHPCFNDKVRHTFGRVHLPVAPRCNIQCKFCNRKYDCINESRPGVTSGVLSPAQAMVYLDSVFEKKKNISVVGLAGPGDPFANPEETMETLRRVRKSYPQMLLCVASNGLGIGPYIDELAQIRVSHVTVTVNAVDLAVAEKIYAWVRHGKRVLHPNEGVKLLLEKQLDAVTRLKEKGIVVKVNSIIIPGINDAHIPEVARKMGEMRVDILNCVPYYPNQGSTFENIPEPSKEMIARIRKEAGKFIPQMHHCTRCRADAVGLLGEDMPQELLKRLKTCESMPEPQALKINASRSFVAVASREGVLVNQHLGEADHLLIYGKKNGAVSLIASRRTPESGGGMRRWDELADSINDCSLLLVSGAGPNPRQALTRKGIEVVEIEGLIDEAVRTVFDGGSLRHLTKRKITACGAECSGTGGGCG
jgi:nitrogen fixation protein NifB